MCVKLSHRNLNLGPSSPHPTNIYTCEVTTVLRVCGGIYIYIVGARAQDRILGLVLYPRL